MDTKAAIKSQYHATLSMLREAIQDCPAQLWDAAVPENRFWQVAYHALYYTHLYLQPTRAEFTPWEHHRPDYESMGHQPEQTMDAITPYTKEEVLAYLDFCHAEVKRQVDSVDLEQESGFSWLPFDKLELQLYNIRHLQHHAGELYERLGVTAQLQAKWIKMRHDLLS